MNNKGHIAVFRKIIDDPIFMQESTKLKLFLYLLLKVNHKTVKFSKCYPRGEHVTSYDIIREQTGLTRNTIAKNLKWLKDNNYIQIVPDKGTHVKIVNYDKYQKNEDTEEDYFQLRQMKYREYLKSSHWKKIRKTKLKNASYKCEKCGNTKKLQIHHLTYERKGNELLSDLIVLCAECHKKEHGIGDASDTKI